MKEAVKDRLRFIPRMIRNQFSMYLECQYYGTKPWCFGHKLLAPLRRLRGRERGQVERQRQVIDHLRQLVSSDKPNILFINSYYPPLDFGGATRVVTSQVQQLKTIYGDDVQLWVLTAAPTELRPFELGLSQVDEVPVLRIGTPLHPRPEWHYRDKRMEDLCRHIFAVVSPTLIHAHSVQRLTTAPLAVAREQALPYIVTVHDAWWINDEQFRIASNGKLLPHDGRDEAALKLSVNRQKAIERLDYLGTVLQGATRLLAVSRFQKDLYSENGFTCDVHENGVDCATFEKKASAEGYIRFLYAGGLAEHKGYYLLKTSFRALRLKRWRGIIVDLSGRKSGEEVWGATRVRYRPAISKDEWPHVYAQLDVVIIPSLVDESFGLLAREALLAGCAVIVADSGGLADCVTPGENGWIFQRTDLSSLAKVLTEADAALPIEFDTAMLRIASSADNAATLARIYEPILSLRGWR